MGCGASKKSEFVVPPNAFLNHYTLAALGTRNVFGPYLKLQSYDPTTGIYRLTVLVICSKNAEQGLLAAVAAGAGGGGGKAGSAGGSPKLSWGEARVSGVIGGAAPTVPLPHSVEGEMLHWWRNWHFWRFKIETTLGDAPKRLVYRVNLLPLVTSTVSLPSRQQVWRWGFYSCNGLDSLDNVAKSGGLEPLWSDLVMHHRESPLHVLVGGGDQLYNDSVFNGPALKGWDKTLADADTEHKAGLPFTQEMRNEVEEYYFSHYCAHWSQPIYSAALSCIPSVNTWDDHDIVDGWGSYPDLIQKSAVMQGLFAAAQLFYLIFQQHTTPVRTVEDGFWCGSSQLLRFGDSTAVVMPDSRTFRTTLQVFPPEFYVELEQRLQALPPSVTHVVVVQAVPVMYPKLNVRKALTKLSDKLTNEDDKVNKLMNKTGLLRKIPMRFGEVEILDDLLDHWDAAPHKAERDKYLRLLMGLSAARGFRVSFLSGDVHCAGYGMFHSRAGVAASAVEDMRLPSVETRAADPKFIPQIISSAITNVPPPSFVLDALRQEAEDPKPVLDDCVGRMVALKKHAVIGTEDDDYLLLGERNWCLVGEPPAESESAARGALHFTLRCEQVLGTGKMHAFTIEVPALRRR